MLYAVRLVNDVKISGFSRVNDTRNDLHEWEKHATINLKGKTKITRTS